MMNKEAKKQMPPEIEIPVAGVIDHGLELVHDITGADRNWLHEVSISDHNIDARQYLRDAGYTLHRGWKHPEGGWQMWVWVKDFPLSVGAWAA
jgi:hypothetical protein